MTTRMNVREAEIHFASIRLEEYRELIARLHQGRGSEAMESLALEWPNIQAGQEFARTLADVADEAAELCCEYAHEPVLLLPRMSGEDLAARWLEPGLASARRLGHRLREALHLRSLGLNASRTDHATRAPEFLW